MTDAIPIGTIVKPNAKWQVTIPAKARKQLNLNDQEVLFNVDVQNQQLVLTPVKKVKPLNDDKESWEKRKKKLLEVMKSDKESWTEEDHQDWEKKTKLIKQSSEKKVEWLKEAW